MEWCKLYATFASDPKVRGLSDRAFRRYVEAMCDTTFHETDGAYFFPRDRATKELIEAGLVDDTAGLEIHGWLNRQRSKAQVVAERARKRRRHTGEESRSLRGGSEDVPTTEKTREEVEEEQTKTQSKRRSASVENNPNQPTDRQMYFADRLGITVPQIVKLNREFGRTHALAAMEQLHGHPPEEPVANPYGWLRVVADFKRTGAA